MLGRETHYGHTHTVNMLPCGAPPSEARLPAGLGQVSAAFLSCIFMFRPCSGHTLAAFGHARCILAAFGRKAAGLT